LLLDHFWSFQVLWGHLRSSFLNYRCSFTKQDINRKSNSILKLMKRKWFKSTLYSFNFSSLYQVNPSMFQKSDLEKFNLKVWHSTCSGERFCMWKLRVASDALENAAELWLWAQSVEIERLFRSEFKITSLQLHFFLTLKWSGRFFWISLYFTSLWKLKKKFHFTLLRFLEKWFFLTSLYFTLNFVSLEVTSLHFTLLKI
jgi:hypothetical protein